MISAKEANKLSCQSLNQKHFDELAIPIHLMFIEKAIKTATEQGKKSCSYNSKDVGLIASCVVSELTKLGYEVVSRHVADVYMLTIIW